MTRTIHTVAVVLVVLLSAAAGAVAFGGSVAALDAGAASTYPQTPGSNTLGTFVYVARPGDAVAKNGIKTITLQTDSGSFENVTENDVFMVVRGGKRIEISNQDSPIVDVKGINVSSNKAGDRLTITLPRPIRPRFASDSPNTGAEVAFKVGNFTTPSRPGSYSVNATLTDPSGTSDGPTATKPYTLSSPSVSMSNQSVSQFKRSQPLNVSAAIPGGGYVGLFTEAPNGSPGKLVGSTNVSDGPTPQNYSIDAGGNISKGQPIMAVAYTESEGRSVTLRAEQSFDPTHDGPLVSNGSLVNATGQVSTIDVDERVSAGGEYDLGTRLYFDQGDPSTSYRISTVENAKLGKSTTQFKTAANGSAIINTSELGQGQYAISRVDDKSVVSLDNDSTTGPGDDSFVVTGQQMAANGTNATNETTNETTVMTTNETTVMTTNGTNATTAGGTAGATTNATETSGATATNGGSSGDASTSGGATEASGNGSSGNASGGEGSGSSGPGFGVAVAVVALLAAALLALRRR